MLAYSKDYDPIKHPEWVGLRHKMAQMIEETQGTVEGRCFV